MKARMLYVVMLLFLLTDCGRQLEFSPEDEAAPLPAKNETETLETYPVEYLEEPCEFPLPKGLIEGERITCGRLIVPEDRANPAQGQVALAVAMIRATDSQNRLSDPIVYIEGGPGVAVLQKLSLVYGQFSVLNQERDFILFDPRGIGLSTPSLDCPEYTELMTSSLQAEVPPEEAEQAALDAVAACSERLLKAGVQLSAYNLAENAADIADLLGALGFEQYNILAVSYGTRTAQLLLSAQPESIRSVVLDSAVPLEEEMLKAVPGNIHRALGELFTACQNDPECSSTYPQLESQLFALVADLDEAPNAAPIVNLISGERYDAVPVDGTSLLNAVISGLYSDDLIPYLPKLIADTASGDVTLLSSLRSTALTGQMFISEGAYYAGLCHDELPFNSIEELQQARNQFPELSNLVLDGTAMAALCADMGIISSSGGANLGLPNEVPVLVMAGQFDPASPPEWGEQIAAGLENAQYLKFQNVGHNVVFSNGCTMDITLGFFEDPQASPAIDCIRQIPLSFITPSGLAEINFVPVSVPETGVQALAPQGWIPAKSDYYVSPDQRYELVFTIEQDAPLEDFLAAWGAVEPAGEVQTVSFTWTVYIVPRPELGKSVMVAVSPAEGGFYLTLAVGPLDEAEAIRDDLFLPVLNAFTISS